MSIADHTTGLLAFWGQTLTWVRKSVSYGSSGDPTITWSSQGTPTGDIQPITANLMRDEIGEKALSTHLILLANATSIIEGDRIRPSGWAAGNDEYQVTGIEAHTPSHVSVFAKLVKGNG